MNCTWLKITICTLVVTDRVFFSYCPRFLNIGMYFAAYYDKVNGSARVLPDSCSLVYYVYKRVFQKDNTLEFTCTLKSPRIIILSESSCSFSMDHSTFSQNDTSMSDLLWRYTQQMKKIKVGSLISINIHFIFVSSKLKRLTARK